MAIKKQKLYCYVDETGQDAGSRLFIVVAVIIVSNINNVRENLQGLEKETHIGKTKWHKSKHKFRMKFMEDFAIQNHKDLSMYFMKARKPILYYVPTLEVIQKAILANSTPNTQAIVCVDGLDQINAKKFTNALRTKILKISLAKGARDNSEVLIRLADRWAGCIRMAISGNQECKNILTKSEKKGLVTEV